jgi:hypothetical protein
MICAFCSGVFSIIFPIIGCIAAKKHNRPLACIYAFIVVFVIAGEVILNIGLLSFVGVLGANQGGAATLNTFVNNTYSTCCVMNPLSNQCAALRVFTKTCTTGVGVQGGLTAFRQIVVNKVQGVVDPIAEGFIVAGALQVLCCVECNFSFQIFACCL